MKKLKSQKGQAHDLVQDFTFKLEENTSDSIRVLAIFEWVCVEYTHNQEMRRNRHGEVESTKTPISQKVFLPKISGFCLQLKPKLTPHRIVVLQLTNMEILLLPLTKRGS